jgi:hypothetical protein
MRLIRNTGSLAIAVAVLAAWTSDAAARPNGQKGAGTTASPYAAQVAALRQTRALLAQANHDYKGHRAAAVKEITAAIHALQPPRTTVAAPKRGPGKGGTPGPKTPGAKTGGKTGGNEPQAVSDAQLQQAITQLTTIQSQLASQTGTGPAAASAAVQKAVQELKTALTIK